MGMALGGFQTQVVIRLTGKLLQRIPDGRWKYTPESAREEAVFLTMEEYIRQCQNMVKHYIATRSL